MYIGDGYSNTCIVKRINARNKFVNTMYGVTVLELGDGRR